MNEWSRRDLIKHAAAGALVLAGGRILAESPTAQSSTGLAQAQAGDLVLVNGRFVDGRGVVASALTVKNGRILKVGDAVALGPAEPTIDLGGRTVIPGLFDSHAHYTRAGVNPGHEARRI